jgi:hypothetical protein
MIGNNEGGHSEPTQLGQVVKDKNASSQKKKGIKVIMRLGRDFQGPD